MVPRQSSPNRPASRISETASEARGDCRLPPTGAPSRPSSEARDVDLLACTCIRRGPAARSAFSCATDANAASASRPTTAGVSGRHLSSASPSTPEPHPMSSAMPRKAAAGRRVKASAKALRRAASWSMSKCHAYASDAIWRTPSASNYPSASSGCHCTAASIDAHCWLLTPAAVAEPRGGSLPHAARAHGRARRRPALRVHGHPPAEANVLSPVSAPGSRVAS
mmetsp:Transcript_30239/g.94101  ORF Transcript_30239/g.94101 Transcript_30239/m.94101 type:complete len:224 (+) Transcript_30239:729-1400(+)